MSGETEDTPSGFTVDTGKEMILRVIGEIDKRFTQEFQGLDARVGQRFDDRIERFNERHHDLVLRLDERQVSADRAVTTAMLAADKAVTAAMLAAEKAVNKAEAASNERFASVNEFRGQLNDQAQTFLPRSEFAVAIGALTEKVTDLQARYDMSSGATHGVTAFRTQMITLAGVLLAAITIAVTILLATR